MRTRTFVATIAIAFVLSSTVIGLGRAVLDAENQSPIEVTLALTQQESGAQR